MRQTLRLATGSNGAFDVVEGFFEVTARARLAAAGWGTSCARVGGVGGVGGGGDTFGEDASGAARREAGDVDVVSGR